MKYKNHPKYENVKISEDGKTIKKFNETLRIAVSHPRKGVNLLTVCLDGRTYISFPKLVNETFNGYPP